MHRRHTKKAGFDGSAVFSNAILTIADNSILGAFRLLPVKLMRNDKQELELTSEMGTLLPQSVVLP